MKRIYEAHLESPHFIGDARRFVALSDTEAVDKVIAGLGAGQTVVLWRSGQFLARLSAPMRRAEGSQAAV